VLFLLIRGDVSYTALVLFLLVSLSCNSSSFDIILLFIGDDSDDLSFNVDVVN